MPRKENDPIFQPELPGFGKSKRIEKQVRKALNPSKETKEESNLYQFPKGTPITWKYSSFYGASKESFQATKKPGEKRNGLQAWILEERVDVRITSGSRYGQKGFIPAGEIVGMYTKGDFSPKKVR